MSSTQSTEAATPTPAIVSPARFHHVGIKTRQLDKMIEFYTKVLGVEPVAAFPFAVFTAYDTEQANHRIVLFTGEHFTGEPDGSRIGLHHLAYEYDDIAELLGNYQALKAQGIVPIWVTNHGPTTSFYYADPDGNQLELQIDNFGDTLKSLEAMKTESFLSNPLGVDIDPDLLVEAHAAGATRDELHARSSAGEFVPEGGTKGPPGLL